MLLESDRIIVYGRKSTESIVAHSIEIGIISLQWLCVVVVMDWIVWIGLYGLDGCADVCAVSVSVLVSDQTQTIVIIFYFLQPPTLH